MPETSPASGRLVRNLGWVLVALGTFGFGLWWAGGEWLVRDWLGTDLAGAPRLMRLHASLDPDVRDLSYFLAMILPAGTRFFGLIGLVGMVLARSPWSSALAVLFRRRADARDLALLRVVVFLSLAIYTNPWEIGRFADLPPDLIVAPVGWGWLLGLVRLSSTWAVPLAWILIGVSVAAATGFCPRVTAWLAVALGIVVLGIPQFYGKINHFHHLIWFGAILAASPAWDVWSLRRGRTSRHSGSQGRSGYPGRGAEYGRPLSWIWLLIGLIYFFPGFWKAAVDAGAWIDGSALATMLHGQWFRMDAVPAVRLDRGILSMLTGSAILVFEIGFVFALVTARARTGFVCAAMLFHVGVFFLAGINFWTLAVCLVAFVPVGAVLDRLSRASQARPVVVQETRPSRAVNTLGAAMVSLMLVAGLTGLDSWPVAVYPTFAGVPDNLYATLILETSDGQRVDPYRSAGLRKAFGQSRIMGMAWHLGSQRETSRDRAAGVLDVFAPYESRLVPGDSVDVLTVHLDIRPEYRREIRRIRHGRFRVGQSPATPAPATRE